MAVKKNEPHIQINITFSEEMLAVLPGAVAALVKGIQDAPVKAERVPVPVKEVPVATPVAAPVATPVEAIPTAPVAQMPVAPVAPPAAPVQETPVAQPVTLPAGLTRIPSVEELMQVGYQMHVAGIDVAAILAKYGAVSVTALPEAVVPAFAADLVALGARF